MDSGLVSGMAMFAGFYHNRRVLVTGHTGFKGSWLSHWLLHLGATVTGVSLPIRPTDRLCGMLDLPQRLHHHEVDIRDGDALAAVIQAAQPEVVLHLAAQPLVRESYAQPQATWASNVLGTVNLLEGVRRCDSVRACVVVTTDKCYHNNEWQWGYREVDRLGGHDPYSASKAAAELVVSSYRQSFFSDPNSCRLASARAGNVIGGGDWAADRIVTDFVTTIAAGETLELRNPQATRPWQHVLEPLSGYLHLAAACHRGEPVCDGWNFGPSDDSVITVDALARQLVAAWGQGQVAHATAAGQPHEAGLLKLDCSKARAQLGWSGVWGIAETVAATVAWYRAAHHGEDVCSVTDQQLTDYYHAAQAAGIAWAQ